MVEMLYRFLGRLRRNLAPDLWVQGSLCLCLLVGLMQRRRPLVSVPLDLFRQIF